jgi:uncharacterized membrane protein
MPEERPLKQRERASPARGPVFAIFIVTALACVLWLGGILFAPYLKSQTSAWSGFVYGLYATVCHQAEGRSLRCFGQPLAVCARCTGIYLGFLLGLLSYPLFRGWRRLALPRGRVFWLVSAPIGLDAAGNLLGLWQTPAAARLALGILWGAILPFYFLTGMAELVISRQKKSA